MQVLPEGKAFAIKDKEFKFSIATRAIDLMRGLKGVSVLDPYHGMLFDFGVEMAVIMTPKGLLMPVEVAFLSEDMEIRETSILDPVLGFTRASSMPVRYALEVPMRFFEEHNLEIGDRFENIAVPG